MTAIDTNLDSEQCISGITQTPPPKRKLSSKTRASVTAAVLDKLIQKKDFVRIAREFGKERYEQSPLYDDTSFNDDKLIDLCRFVALGLSEQSAARAIGISVQTLKAWKREIPGVMEEIVRARYLAIGAVASILRMFMVSENDAVALRATEFFLKTRSKEFREKQEVEVEFDTTSLQRKIKEDLYGKNDDTKRVHVISRQPTLPDAESAKPSRSGEQFEI